MAGATLRDRNACLSHLNSVLRESKKLPSSASNSYLSCSSAIIRSKFFCHKNAIWIIRVITKRPTTRKSSPLIEAMRWLKRLLRTRL